MPNQTPTQQVQSNSTLESSSTQPLPVSAPATPTPQPTTPAVAQEAAPATQETNQQPIEEDEKFFAALGYFAFLFVVPLLVKPKSKYCKFHATQSIVLFLTAILVLVVLAAIPWFGSLLTLAIFAVYVLAIYKAYKGDYWSIPFISKFTKKMNVDALYGKAGLAISSVSGLKEKAGTLADKATGVVSVSSVSVQQDSQSSSETPPPETSAK